MAAPLVISTKGEQTSMIHFVSSDSMAGAAVYESICAHCGRTVLSRISMYE